MTDKGLISRVYKQLIQLNIQKNADGTNTHTRTHTQWTTSQPQKIMKILPFAATWMDLEGIMLSAIRQRKIV